MDAAAAAAAAAVPRMLKPVDRGRQLLGDVAAATAASNWDRLGGLRCRFGGERRSLVEVEVVGLLSLVVVVLSLLPVPVPVPATVGAEEDICREGRTEETDEDGVGYEIETNPRGSR